VDERLAERVVVRLPSGDAGRAAGPPGSGLAHPSKPCKTQPIAMRPEGDCGPMPILSLFH